MVSDPKVILFEEGRVDVLVEIRPQGEAGIHAISNRQTKYHHLARREGSLCPIGRPRRPNDSCNIQLSDERINSQFTGIARGVAG